MGGDRPHPNGMARTFESGYRKVNVNRIYRRIGLAFKMREFMRDKVGGIVVCGRLAME
jgi:hypothetical protein